MINTPPKFLVCVDKNEESIAALRFSCLKAKMRGAIIDLIHVLPPDDFQTLGSIAERISEERRLEGQRMLEELGAKVEAINGVKPGMILREGEAGEEIIKTISELSDISLLIIGTAHHMRGRGKLAAWLAGQLGQKLFIPLLMVPGNLTEEQIQGLM